MSSFLIGIRKYVESDELHHWLLITAKPAAQEEQEGERKVKFTSVSPADLYIQGINAIQWKVFIIITVMLNIFIFISYFWLGSNTQSPVVIVTMHLTCFFYWLDFIGAVMAKVRSRKRLENPRIRSILFLVLDAISLLPLSTVYLIAVRYLDGALLWQLRAITVIRFYRVPQFFSQLSSVERNHWNVMLSAYACYLAFFIVVFANLFLWRVDEYTPITIENWNTTNFNRMVVSFYYALQMTFNVGYGDIGPKSYFQIIVNSLALFVGTAFSSGIFSGILAIAFTNKAKRREYYRYEFEATKKTLVERKIDKKVVNNILDNMTTIWRYKTGYTDPPVYILPLSLLKELYFDVNFSHLKHSLIFSMKPRSFLRSVAILMKNLTYLPGDIIMEPSGMSDVMICVASGVIEVLSQESEDSVLFSLTMGTIIGEATLFIPLPVRCKIRASTYVELQVLKKVDFSRLALTYPAIFRSMRSEIYFRLQFKEDMTTMQANVFSGEMTEARRKTKKFLKNLKNDMDLEEMGEDKFYTQKAAILRLYVLSENIPRVKTLPINLIREKPWILRPNTPLTKLWNLCLVIVAIAAGVMYPFLAGFHREIESWVYAVLVIFKGFYIVDVYLECTIAISRKDHFTYVTSIKHIIAQKLKTVGFYLDVLSTYHFAIYSNLLWPEHIEYIHLLLSLNALLKTWRTVVYMKELENDMKNNLLFIVTVKYVIWIVIITTWGAVVLYLEAHPGDDYVEGRWFYNIKNESSIPATASPTVVSFYFAVATLLALGYGDIVPTTIIDCVVVIVCIIAGFILCVVCVSETSAAIKHWAKIRTSYQEELFAVDRFMSEHEIPKEFQQRVRRYLRLQWNYDKGYSLKRISISTVLLGLQKHILIMELFKTFLCVPLFRDATPDFIKLLTKLCKVRVLPPDEAVAEIGSYIREMYIIENGYCRVTDAEASHSKIIGPLTHFGFLVMVSGREHQIRVETLTHVRIVSLNYAAYLKAITKYPETKIEIENAMTDYYDIQNEFDGSTGEEEEAEEQNKSDLKIRKQFLSKAFVNVYAYHKNLPDKYWAPFHNWGKYRIFQFLFLPFSILPNSPFLHIWMTIRIINALIIGIIAPIQFSILNDEHIFMKFIIVLQILAAVDMYLMFHVAYYNKRGLLIFHPAKTVLHYLKGNFALDLVAAFPYYWVVLAMYPKNHKHLGFFARTFGMIIVLQLYKYFLGWYHFEGDILRKTAIIKILKLFPFLLLVINFVTALVILIQCHEVRNTKIQEIAGGTKLAQELVDSITSFCLHSTNRTSTEVIVQHQRFIFLFFPFPMAQFLYLQICVIFSNT